MGFRFKMDELNKTLLISAGVCLLVSMVLSNVPAATVTFRVLFALCAVYFVFRQFSKKQDRRYQENLQYLTFVTGIKEFFKKLFHPQQKNRGQRSKLGEKWYQYRHFKYLICPQCAQRLRVPKGKGKIMVTCPNCRNRFLAKS